MPMNIGKFPLVLLLLIVIVSTVSLLPMQEVEAAPVELAYDDGTYDGHAAQPPAGTLAAVRFSLPDGVSSAKLLTARYFIAYSPSMFTVYIYDSDFTTKLCPSFDVTPGGTGWFDVDLTSKNIVVRGDFFIAIEWLSTSPGIGTDDNSPATGRSYYQNLGEEWTLWPGLDLMIRAVIDPITPVGGVVVPTNTLAILTPYLALAGLIAAISTIFVIKKRK
jgi:hypothetical protein